MRKFILVLMFLFSFSVSCFASDIYIGEVEDYAMYLRTESIEAKDVIRQGSPYSYSTLTYTLIMIPNPEKLIKLKRQCLNDDIEYREERLKMSSTYNRVEREWLDYVSIEEISVVLCGGGKTLFRSHDLSKDIPFYGDSSAAIANRKIRHEIFSIIHDNPKMLQATIE